MTDWGSHGVRTADLWDQLFREIVEPTATFASGVVSPMVRFRPPFVQKNAAATDIDVFGRRGTLDYGGPSYSYGDQAVIEGGPNPRSVDPTGVYLTNTDGSSRFAINTRRDAETDVARVEIARREITQLQYPWQFYALGQKYLARLVALKPLRTASIEHRMIWAVDAAWWINQMLGATNVYPAWIPDTMGRLLSGSAWRAWEWVPGRAELAPALGLSIVDSGFYPLPFAVNPGSYNSAGLIRDTRIDGGELAHIRRWAEARPWWLGIQTYGDFDAVRVHAQGEDPRMDANLLRACGQHSFFQFPERGNITNGSFFDTIRNVQTNSRVRDQLETYTETLLPAWLSAMQRLPYWSFVRAGSYSWNQFSSGALTIARGRGESEDKWHFPYTAKEAMGLKKEWAIAKDDATVMLVFSTYLTTWWGVFQMALGNVGSAQIDALKAWYAAASYRYKVPKSWENSWEPPPVVMRMVQTSQYCLMPSRDGTGACSSTAYGPDARVFSVGDSVLYVDAALKQLGQTGHVALRTSDGTDEIAAFERATDVVVAPVQSSVPTQDASVVTEVSTPWSPTAFPTRKRSVVPYVVGGVAAVVGIILATRNRRT